MPKKKPQKIEERRSITERNRSTKNVKEGHRRESLAARTRALVGSPVQIRVKDHVKPLVGTVSAVVDKTSDDYPQDAKRHTGRYLKVSTTFGTYLRSRHRVKPLKGESL